MSHYKKTQKKDGKLTFKQFTMLLPILITIGLTPLLVRLKVLQVPKSEMVWKADAIVTRSDLFSYYKSQILILIAIVCLIIIIYSLLKKKWSLKSFPHFYFLFGYTLLVLCSTILSSHIHVSLIGYDERFEGMFVLLSYIVIFIYTVMTIKSKQQLDIVLSIWIFSIIILFIIGLTQYFQHDIILSSFGRFLTLPSQYRDISAIGDSDAIRNVYQTLYHYNYVSFYAAIGFPFFLVLAISEKSFKCKILFYSLSFIFIINQMISLSRNGYIGIIAGLVFVIIFLRHKLLTYWKIILPLFTLLLITSIFFVITSDSLTAQRLRNGFISLTVQKENQLNSIEAHENSLIINHDSFEFIITAQTKNDTITFTATDINGNILNTLYNDTIKHTALEGIEPAILSYDAVILNNVPTIQLNMFNSKWYFSYNNNKFLFVNPDSTYSPIAVAPSFGFEGREKFASARGYIWSRTFPIILSNGILGSGPDTFALEFNQSDYVGKYNAYDTPYIIVDKPHNVFLNYASNTGLLSLILLLIFWIHYIYSSFKLYFNTDLSNYFNRIGIASLCSVIGYFASGLFNDTSVSITPTFWVIIGIGYSMNYLNRTKSRD